MITRGIMMSDKLFKCDEGCGPEYTRVCAGCFWATKAGLKKLRDELDEAHKVVMETAFKLGQAEAACDALRSEVERLKGGGH